MFRDLTKNKVRSLSLLLVSALACSCMLTGCGAGGINSPCDIKYITENPLTVENIYCERDGTPRDGEYPTPYDLEQMSDEERAEWEGKDVSFDGSYIQIDGLKDQETEEKINKKLKQLFTDNVDRVPPYRGVKARLGENPQQDADSRSFADSYVAGNFNNILSVALNTVYTYKNTETGEFVTINGTETLNIDLNTGDEIPLRELFCDDVDAIEYVNSKIREELEDSYATEEEWIYDDHLKLTSPFESISEDQKYDVSPYGIVLLFDYETPEFYTDMYATSFLIPFDESMAITERFFDKNENIYTSEEPPVKTIIIHSPVNDGQLSDETVENGITISKSAGYSKDAPAFIKKRIKALYEVDNEELSANIKPYYEEAKEKSPNEEIYASCTRMISSSTVGDFVTVAATDYYYVAAWENGYTYDAEIRHYETYRKDGDEFEKLQLEDIFADKGKMEDIVKTAMEKSIKAWIDQGEETVMEFGKGELAEKDERYLDLVYENIDGFELQGSLLNLGGKKPLSEIYEEVYGEVENDLTRACIYAPAWLSYSDLGCDNLTVFD